MIKTRWNVCCGSKLLCYTALSAAVLIAHAGSQPFDDRKNKLLDRVESQGLVARFVTFVSIMLIMVFNPGMKVGSKNLILLLKFLYKRRYQLIAKSNKDDLNNSATHLYVYIG